MSIFEALEDLVFGMPRHPLYRNRIVDAWRALRCPGELLYAAARPGAAGGKCDKAEPRGVEVFCPDGGEKCERCPRFHGYRKAADMDFQCGPAELEELERFKGDGEGAEVARGDAERIARSAAGDKVRLEAQPHLVAPPCVPGVEDAERRADAGDAECDGFGYEGTEVHK